MKTAISLPDELFEEGEQVAKRLAVTRSELYARALSEFVGRYRAGEVRDSYDRAYGDEATDAASRFRRAAARRAFQSSEW
jgi:metal-responsive CopG/Arc/MetJ family transcriptional regulator